MADQTLAQTRALRKISGVRRMGRRRFSALWSFFSGLPLEVRGAIRHRASQKVFFTRQKPEYAEYSIGEWTYGAPAVANFRDGGTLVVGRFCSIGQNVSILLGGEHRYDWVTTYPFNVVCDDARSFVGHPRSKGPVTFGNDVWIGFGATILSGVNIGDGAVVGARSLVVTDVPPYAIVAGNPARVIKYRFKQEQIAALLEIRWWDWPIDKIREAWPLLLSDNIDGFIGAYGKLEDALPDRELLGSTGNG